jgi:hypothetical protein
LIDDSSDWVLSFSLSSNRGSPEPSPRPPVPKCTGVLGAVPAADRGLCEHCGMPVVSMVGAIDLLRDNKSSCKVGDQPRTETKPTFSASGPTNANIILPRSQHLRRPIQGHQRQNTKHHTNSGDPRGRRISQPLCLDTASSAVAHSTQQPIFIRHNRDKRGQRWSAKSATASS